MRFLRRGLVGLVLVSLTAALLALAGEQIVSAFQARMADEGGARPARERVFSARVVTIRPERIAPVLTTFGEVRSRRTLELRAPAGGRVVELATNFEDGARTEQGQLLMRVEQADASAALALARADLARAQAELEDARRALELAGDELAAAEDQAALRSRALERRRSLAERGVGSEAAVEEAELALSSARQAVLARRQAVAQAEARVGEGETALSRQRIAVEEAERRLEDTELHAAFTGTLSDVTVVEGGLVSVNERLAQLIDPDALEVSFRLSTSQYARLLDAEGALIPADVEIALDVLGTEIVTTGTLARVSAAVGEGQTGRLVYARLEAPRGFRPGDFVTVRVREPALDNVARLPATAVDTAGTVLVVGEDNRLESATVAVLRREGDDVIARAPGLAGAEIVAERAPMLGAGIRINPVRPDAPDTDGDGAAGEAASAGRSREMLSLSDERREALIARVRASDMPDAARERVIAQLSQDRVPARVVERLEARSGG